MFQNDYKILLLFRVKFSEEDEFQDIKSNFITLGKLFKINNSQKDFNNLYDELKERLAIKDQSYKNLPIQKITFNYKIIDLDNDKISKTTTISKTKKLKIKTYTFRGYNLPNTMDINLWGNNFSIDKNITLIKKKGSKSIYEVEFIKENNEFINNVKLMLPNKEVLLTYKDVRNIKDPINTFTRYMG
jgi:hypothetical protein